MTGRWQRERSGKDRGSEGVQHLSTTRYEAITSIASQAYVRSPHRTSKPPRYMYLSKVTSCNKVFVLTSTSLAPEKLWIQSSFTLKMMIVLVQYSIPP